MHAPGSGIHNLHQPEPTSFRGAWIPAAVFVDDRWESSDPHADIYASLPRAPPFRPGFYLVSLGNSSFYILSLIGS